MKSDLKLPSLLASILLLLVVTVFPASAAPSIQISKAVFVTQADGFGNYTREEDNHFISGSKTSVYVELDNFTVKKDDEKYEINIRVELDVIDSEEKIVAKSDKVFALNKDLKSNQRDLSFKVPLDFSKWKTGKYTLVFKATDNIRNMLHIKQVPLEIF